MMPMTEKYEALIAALPEKLFAGFEDTAGAGHHGPKDGRRIFVNMHEDDLVTLSGLTPEEATERLVQVCIFEPAVAKAIVRALQASGYVELLIKPTD